jgi:hypothetical protein
MTALLLCISSFSASAQEKRQPVVGDDCVQTEYDCQPTKIEQKTYDNMNVGVEMKRDLPALVELEPLDAPDKAIQRYIVNTRGIMGREVPIPQSVGQFCTLSYNTNMRLAYFPASGVWNFIVDYSQDAELAAGGLATCFKLPAAEPSK